MLRPDQLEKSVGEHPCPATEQEIEALENVLGVRLPAELVELLKVNDQGRLGPFVTKYDRDFIFDLCAVEVSRFRYVGGDILSSWSCLGYPTDLVPIGDVANGDEILLNYRENPAKPSVWLRDHELNTGERAMMEYLAPDFASLLEVMGQDKHFGHAMEEFELLCQDIEIDELQEFEGEDEIDWHEDALMVLAQILDMYPSAPRPPTVERTLRTFRKYAESEKREQG